jgi:hypothetical protein
MMTILMGVTGWYKDPSMANVFIPVVTAIEIAGLIWGLGKTAAAGRTYSGQVVAGTMIAFVAGLVIICASLLFTTVLFPESLAAVGANGSPLQSALAGFLGTMMTGIIASAVIAVWIRARS